MKPPSPHKPALLRQPSAQTPPPPSQSAPSFSAPHHKRVSIQQQKCAAPSIADSCVHFLPKSRASISHAPHHRTQVAPNLGHVGAQDAARTSVSFFFAISFCDHFSAVNQPSAGMKHSTSRLNR